MKTFIKFFAIALLALPFVACDDDDDDVNLSAVPQTVKEAFDSKYPNATDVSWEHKGGYYTAEWKETNGMRDVEAWFRNNQQVSDSWAMTETDFGKNTFLIPSELNLAFNQTEYATATIDDIDLYEYPDASKNVYIFEVTPTGQRSDVLVVFKASDYTFVKAVPDTDVDITPDTTI